MSKDRSQEHFKELTAAFLAGRISRRRFIHQAASLGISAALLSRVFPQAFAAGYNLVDSAPEAPNDSPITKERIEFLKKKPYKDTTINVLQLKATAADGIKYCAPKCEQE